MKKLLLITICTLLGFQTGYGQYVFSKTYGGDADERAMAVVQSRNGEYVVAGLTFSFGKGKSDIWVMKIDTQGKEQWRRVLGSQDFDWANDLIETRNGDFVLVGYSRDPRTRNNNAWVLKMDPNGKVIWSRTFGGEKGDEAKSVVETADGGLAIAGFSYSYGRGSSDMWLLRLDIHGKELWQQTYGAEGPEQAFDVIEARNGALVLGGFSNSIGNGKADMVLVKVDPFGKFIWRKNYGGPENDAIESIIEDEQGNYVLAGWTYSGPSQTMDAQLLKVDSRGNKMWRRTYGGKGKDAFYDLCRTYDGSLAVVGSSSSFRQREQADVWMLKADAAGRMQWQHTTRGDKNDFGYGISHTRDGGFMVVGSSQSYAKGGSDMWVVKTGPEGRMGGVPAYDNIATTPSPAQPTPPTAGNPYKPNLFILAVGVSQFEDQSMNLTYAHSDAVAITRKFSQMKGSLFNEVKARVLLNEKATLTNIKKSITWLERQATQKDLILIFISSHGALDHKGSLYILPNDFNAYNLFATGLNIRDLTEGMNGTPCKKLILLDACHSGQSGNDLLAFANAKGSHVNDAIEELVKKEPGVTVMTSSSGKEYSYENPSWGHGAFTKAMLEGLEGRADYNQNKVIGLLELNLFVTNRVKELTGGRQHPYTPINQFGDIPLFILK